MKYIPLFVLLLSIYSCDNEKRKKGNSVAEQEEIQTQLQKQLDEEFGEYTEAVKPEDRDYYKAYDKVLTLWKTPFHELNIPTRHGNAHVIVSGPKNAEPLVLLHGMNASSTMWHPNIKALSQNHRVYAIDYLLEPGKSTMTVEVKDMKEITRWYFEIFDHLKLKQFTLIGASEGGWLAVNIALHQRSRIRSMILLSPLQTFIWIRRGIKITSDIIYSLHPQRKHLRSVLETMSVHVDKMDPAYVDQYFIATQKADNNLLMFQMTPFSDDEFKTLTMPVLVLIGDQDIINKEKSIDKARELLPHVETGIIKDAGHFLSMDQPEIIDQRILDFLSKNHLNGIAP